MFTKEKYDREVIVIPVDFSDGMEVYPNIAEQLNDLDIGVLGTQLAKFIVVPYSGEFSREKTFADR